MKEVLFRGVCTAMVTPFRNGQVDYAVLEALLQRQIDCGVKAVLVCGTTGESSTMTEEEIFCVIAHTVRFCAGKVKVIAGTGSNNTGTAAARSKIASAMGVDAVLVVTPYYNKTSADGLIRHYTTVADEADCPVILYNVPSRTGLDVPVSVYAELAKHPGIIGVKEASGSIAKVQKLRTACGEGFALWSGNDDQTVAMCSVGGDGIISVASNLCPLEICAMTNACISGDYTLAGKLQNSYMDLIESLFAEVNPIPIKRALQLIGFEVGEPRPPLCALSAGAEHLLLDAMKNHGIYLA